MPNRLRTTGRALHLAPALFALLAAVAAPSHAACWNPTDARSADASFLGKSFTPLREAAQTAESVIRENPVLATLPETHGRIRRDVGYLGTDPQPRAVGIHSGLYWKEAWTSAPCGVHPEADRIPPAHAVALIIHINHAHFLKPHTYDEGQPVFFAQPEVLRTFRGFPMYGYPDDYRGAMQLKPLDGVLMMSVGGRTPWQPVTYAEYLDLLERKQKQVDAERQKNMAAAQTVDETKIWAVYERMKKSDPAGAEKYRQSMAAFLADVHNPNSAMNRKRTQGQAAVNAAAAGELAKIEQLRRQLGPAGLAAQAYAGTGTPGYPSGVTTAADRNGTPLVKRNDSFWDAKDKSRVQLLTLMIYGRVPQETLDNAMDVMDLARLQALLR